MFNNDESSIHSLLYYYSRLQLIKPKLSYNYHFLYLYIFPRHSQHLPKDWEQHESMISNQHFDAKIPDSTTSNRL